MAIKNTSLGGTDWTDDEIVTATDLNDTIDAMASKALTLSAFWLNTSLYDVYDNFESFGQNPYVEITASSVSDTADFSINNCTLTDQGGGVWKLTSSSTSIEVQRAEIYKTLFYGTDGSDPRASATYITSITAIATSVTRDIGKQAHLSTMYKSADTTSTSDDGDYTGTFANTSTNTDCSIWSNITTFDGYLAYFEVPSGTVINSETTTPGVSSNEIGLDKTDDELDNPATVKLNMDCNRNSNNGANGLNGAFFVHSIILCVGDITWVETDTNSKYTGANTDFFTDNSIPLFTAVSGSPSFPGDESKWTTATSTGGSGSPSASITVVESTNAGGSGNELKINAAGAGAGPGSGAGNATAIAKAIALEANKHTHMKIYSEESGEAEDGHNSLSQVSFDGGSTYFNICQVTKGGAANSSTMSHAVNSDILVVAKGSDEYDCYIGGNLVDNVTDASFEIWIKTYSSTDVALDTNVYVDDVRQSKNTIS